MQVSKNLTQCSADMTATDCKPSRSKTQPLKTSSSRLRKMLQKNLSVPNCILKMGEVMFNSEREKIYILQILQQNKDFYFSLLFFNKLCHSEIDLDLVQ